MPNTFASLPNRLADISVPVIEKVLAPFSAFVTDFQAVDRRSVDMTHHTVVSSTEENPTSYFKQEDTTDRVVVPLSEFSQQFGIGTQEYLQGHRLETLVARNAQKLSETLWDNVMAKVNNTSFPNGMIDAAEDAFGTEETKAAYASIPGTSSKVLVLSPVSYAELMVIVGRDTATAGAAMYSFDGVYECNKWDGAAQANMYGFAAGPEALLLGSGIPTYSSRVMETIDEEIVQIPGVGLSVAFRHQIDPESRSEQATMDILFGSLANPGGQTALTIIRTGL